MQDENLVLLHVSILGLLTKLGKASARAHLTTGLRASLTMWHALSNNALEKVATIRIKKYQGSIYIPGPASFYSDDSAHCTTYGSQPSVAFHLFKYSIVNALQA